MRLALIGIAALILVQPAAAQNLAISLGIRETEAGGGPIGVPLGGDGGTTGGIEHVNRDGQSLLLDGSWQLFTFNFQSDPVTAFAGLTANSLYDGTRGTFEAIRIRNTEGHTQPIRLWVDQIVNTSPRAAEVITGFEGYGNGTEVMFNAPKHSGSTFANLTGPNSALTTDIVAYAGSSSLEVNFQFVDNDPARWVRFYTFNAPNLPNPVIDFSPGNTVTFAMRGLLVPEPGSAVLLMIGAVGALMWRVRRRR